MNAHTVTREDLIALFEAAPDANWCTGNYKNFNGQSCALGHCGDRNAKHGQTPQSRALRSLLPFGGTDINDGYDPRYNQPTPKARILAALRDLPL